MDDLKAVLTQYLDEQHAALLWKVDGLGEYDLRRPLTPTGTNLLGLVKHVAAVEAEYFGLVFGRPFPDAPAWLLDEEPADNVDMWVTAEESTASILDLFARVREHGAETIAALDLDATGVVPWWGNGGVEVTLGRIVVHMLAEVARHAGHADIVRESIDAAAGLSDGNDNLPSQDAAWWREYYDRVQSAAREAARRTD
ncbi:DinB family protein [Ruania zhangjianzhongii]|uniref:DinB family protein n=1 Tax=Ruania zhangjianzhongii TaxID=2603206 RepID=UPI0011CA38AC|nr:DinB family protein [Ruania zhangjianzhongii]